MLEAQLIKKKISKLEKEYLKAGKIRRKRLLRKGEKLLLRLNQIMER